MRKLLMMACCATVLTAMCFIPSMRGDNPCPNEVVNESSKYLCSPVSKDYDTSNIGKGGVPLIIEKFCSAAGTSGKDDCVKQKVVVSINPDRSIGVNIPIHATYIDVWHSDPLTNVPEFTVCFAYRTCKFVGSPPSCVDDQSYESYQLDYAEYPCQ